jgi:DNA-binding protein YbaB
MEDGDREMLEDLTQAAFSSAMEKVRDAIAGEMGGMFPGGIPGLNFSGLPGMPA